ncbi:MAG: hypothetical protein ACF8NJ_10165, partial [Phycisphaerales bacterium JB038]
LVSQFQTVSKMTKQMANMGAMGKVKAIREMSKAGPDALPGVGGLGAMPGLGGKGSTKTTSRKKGFKSRGKKKRR